MSATSSPRPSSSSNTPLDRGASPPPAPAGLAGATGQPGPSGVAAETGRHPASGTSCGCGAGPSCCRGEPRFADRFEMQNRLFGELSRMFGSEVPLYDKSLLVNQVCNRAVCDLLARKYPGFAVSDEELERTSGERHGAIRIGRPDEYRWIARFFACFAMEPHNYYDMTSLGAKSQPVIATAFRSLVRPEHRVFTSLLMTDYFDPATRARVEGLLATREVFPPRAKALIEMCERQGGLEWSDAEALIREGTERIFKWTGRARDHGLYRDLCDAGFKIAADIACFESHHLNHLTPNTLCMDLFTAGMKLCLGELTTAQFRQRAVAALRHLEASADLDWLRLHFKHLPADTLRPLARTRLAEGAVEAAADALLARLREPDLDLSGLRHAGFKDFTEGPPRETPVLLRQDAYRALTEPVVFAQPDGTKVEASHTARFGEIEQRFYATTPAGRALYDRCLAAADAERERDPELAKRDHAVHLSAQARHYDDFPRTLPELLERGLVYGRYAATAKGRAAAGTLDSTDLHALVRQGLVDVEGLRYEDFLPVSAAGIFASNLNQYGTKSTAAVKPEYPRALLEQIMGRPIVDADVVYRGMEAASLLQTFADLGLLDRLPRQRREALEAAVAACPENSLKAH